ncbi:MAG: choice-of-anchor Q domain-containing protein [Aggregatilineales bacterium]
MPLTPSRSIRGERIVIYRGLVNNGFNKEHPTPWQSTRCGIPQSLNFFLNNLGINGGPTETMPSIGPYNTDPIVDAIPYASCPTTTDQRGVARQIGLNPLNCDIGAYEVTLDKNGNDIFPSIVNVLDDLDLGNCTYGVPNAHCSLREAIKYSPPGSTITFAPGLTGPIYLTLGVLNIPNESLTITGPTTAPGITIDGQNATSLFYIGSLQFNTVTFNNLTFAHGNGYYGGAFYFGGPGTLNFNNDLFTQNYTSQYGRAIQCDCTGTLVNIANSTFDHNAEAITGGAINNLAGRITIADSTFAANISGAGYNYSNAMGSFSPNRIQLYNTVVAAGASGPNCSGVTSSSSNNVEYPSASCGTGVTVASGYPLSGSAPTNNGGPHANL